MTGPCILLAVSRRWADREAITDALRDAVDSLIRDGDTGPMVLVHAHRADPVADALWRGWHDLRPDWFAEPELHRTVANLANATVCLAFILNGSRVPTAVAVLAQAAGIPVRIVRAGAVA